MTPLEHIFVYFLSLATAIVFAFYCYRYGDLNHEYSSWGKRQRKKYGALAVLFWTITAILNAAQFYQQ